MRAALFAMVVVACGGSTSNNSDGGVQSMDLDADTDVEIDAGDPDTGVPYPAPFPPPPQVANSGGPRIVSGKVVPVFWANDSLQTQVEQFLQMMSPSPYWTAVTKEYGVGDFKTLPSIVITDPAPSTIDDAGIQTWLQQHADGSDMAWPYADPSTVYALFYPAGTSITLQNSQSCSGFGAYHSNTTLANNTAFAYAVMPRCNGGIDSLTASTSHELDEWATDPFPMSNPAFQTVDRDHLYWALAGGEVTDMCEFASTAYGRILGNFVVSRSWSNASIKAGHDPCVPAPAGAFFAAAPESPDSVIYTYYGQKIKVRGVNVPVGTSKTIAVHLYSDAPTAPWTVTATTGFSSQGSLTFAFDTNKGQNGDVLALTITAVKATASGTARFNVTSVNAQNQRHTWFGLVGF